MNDPKPPTEAISVVIALCVFVGLCFVVFLCREACCRGESVFERQEINAQLRENFVERVREHRDLEQLIAAGQMTPEQKPAVGRFLAVSTC